MHLALRQIAEDDTTRKLLLVGHSQGALYANSMYDYLTSHGEPSRALDIYAVATPASYVAGGGRYITSAEDAVIFASRALAQKLGVPAPLPYNAEIGGSLAPPDLPATHAFTTYLNGATDQMVTDIDAELDGLQGGQLSNSDCITPPPLTAADKTQQIVFAVADPTANVARTGVVLAYQGTATAITAAVDLARAGYGAVASALHYVAGPQANPAALQNEEKNFTVVKQLYGSSIDKNTYKELNSNQAGAVALALPPHFDSEIQTTATSTETATTTATTTPVILLQIATTTATTSPIATTSPALATTTQATSTPATDSWFTPGSSLPSPYEHQSGASTTATSTATTTTATSTAPSLFDASTTPPTLTVAECGSSLNPNFCLIGTTTATLSWTAVTDAVFYEVEINGAQTATTTHTNASVTLQDGATSTLEVIAFDASNDTATSSPQDVAVRVPFTPEHSPISDTFDTFNSLGWEDLGQNQKNFEFDDGTDGSCFKNGCAVGIATTSEFINLIPRMGLKAGPALSSGAYTVYAKAARGFNAPTPVISFCETGFASCNDNGAIQGITLTNVIVIDNAWHQYYVAWRQGSAFVQTCALMDDTNSADCVWRDNTNMLKGTQFDGLALWSQNGYRNDLGGNLWFDELEAQ